MIKDASSDPLQMLWNFSIVTTQLEVQWTSDKSFITSEALSYNYDNDVRNQRNGLTTCNIKTMKEDGIFEGKNVKIKIGSTVHACSRVLKIRRSSKISPGIDDLDIPISCPTLLNTWYRRFPAEFMRSSLLKMSPLLYISSWQNWEGWETQLNNTQIEKTTETMHRSRTPIVGHNNKIINYPSRQIPDWHVYGWYCKNCAQVITQINGNKIKLNEQEHSNAIFAHIMTSLTYSWMKNNSQTSLLLNEWILESD